MTRIKDLNSMPEISASDFVPIFSVANDATRKATVQELAVHVAPLVDEGALALAAAATESANTASAAADTLTASTTALTAEIYGDKEKLNQVVNGDENTTVETDGGPVRSLAKVMADNDAAINAAGLLGDVNASKADAEAAKTAAESARDAAIIQAGVYADEPTGRAAVADGQAFKVQGSGDVAAYEYRRTSSSASALIATYPSLAALEAVTTASLDLFKRDDTELFPSANLLVRRYTAAATFNDYAAGYSQTASGSGLQVAIPTAGSGSIKHYLRTGITADGAPRVSAVFSAVGSLSGSAAIGFGYLSAGVYKGYALSQSGNLYSLSDFGSTLLASGLGSYTTGAVLRYDVEGGVLSVYVNGVLITSRTLAAGEYETDELLFCQFGFGSYAAKVERFADPVRAHVAAEITAIGATSPCFYSYNPTGSLHGSGQFKAYVKLAAGRYIGFEIGREVNMADLVYVDYWRLEQAKFYTYDGATMSDTGKYALIGGESECVFKRTASKDDFTGGYHGDEIMQDVAFFASGVKIDPALLTSSIALTPCSDFFYMEKSTMHATAEGGVFIPGHPVECHHIKQTHFRDAGYETFNRLTWDTAGLVTLWYHGISCIGKDTATTCYTDDAFAPLAFDGSNVIRLASVGDREMRGWNTTTGYAAYVTSEITKPAASDAAADLFINDRPTDSKYYREQQPMTVTAGEVWESTMRVQFSTING